MYGKFAAPTSVEFAPVPYFLENPSYLFEDRQKQLFVLTSAAAGLGKVPARLHVLSHAGAHAIQVFTDWLLERVKASYVEPFLSLRISDVGPLLPTENGSLFSPMYMPPAGDDPGVHWKGLRRCHRLKLGHLTYSEISKYIVSGMGRPTSLAPFKSLAKTERASYAYAFTRTAGPIMLDSHAPQGRLTLDTRPDGGWCILRGMASVVDNYAGRVARALRDRGVSSAEALRMVQAAEGAVRLGHKRGMLPSELASVLWHPSVGRGRAGGFSRGRGRSGGRSTVADAVGCAAAPIEAYLFDEPASEPPKCG